MIVKALTRRNLYCDSVMMMTLGGALQRLPGVDAVMAGMATPANLDVLREAGLTWPEMDELTPNDLVIAVRAAGQAEMDAALAEAEAGLARTARPPDTHPDQPPARSLSRAAQSLDGGASLAMISVPGAYAAVEAEEALRAGLDVFLFSDNVSLAEEIRLKRLARDQGRLLMGPDCGTAIVGGVGLGFANVVRGGSIGIASASGTGLQQVACLIDAGGGGISHALGTGGRDLRQEVGGLAMSHAISLLGADPGTQVLLLISKPPAPDVARRILEQAAATGKPVVAALLGADVAAYAVPGVQVARTLTEAASLALQAAGIEEAGIEEADASAPGEPGADVLQASRANLRPGQRYVRGLFAGGTLCEEALLILQEALGVEIVTNVHGHAVSDEESAAAQHVILDLGADEYTVGRPHPMIDPDARDPRILGAATDQSVGCILLDVVLGYGAHADPAVLLSEVIRTATAQASAAGRALPIVVSLCGTEADPQRWSAQARLLRDAGALVFGSNARAAAFVAGLIAEKRGIA